MHWPSFFDLYCLELLSSPVCASWDDPIRYVRMPLLIPTWCSEPVQYRNVNAAFLHQMIKEILPDPSWAANSSFPPPLQPSIPATHRVLPPVLLPSAQAVFPGGWKRLSHGRDAQQAAILKQKKFSEISILLEQE